MEFVENGERGREVHTCSVSVRHLELSPLTSVFTMHVPISSGITLYNLGVISLSCYFQHIYIHIHNLYNISTNMQYISFLYIYIFTWINIYIYSPTPVGLSSPANEVIVLPLAFIASLFIYEVRSRLPLNGCM